MASSRPNLFGYATKELSQDAMICWLIDWAGQEEVEDPRDRALRDCGRLFVHALLAKHGVHLNVDEAVTTTDIYQQDHGIDVLARVIGEREKHILLIEDKTDTEDPSDKLQRYCDAVKNGETSLGRVARRRIFPVYLKTGNQSRSKDLEIEHNTPYRVFNRDNFLLVLDQYKGRNPILTDFRQYLHQKERDTNGFKRWERSTRQQWSWAAWQGLFRCLEDRLGKGGWNYVSNPAGGFLGFYWHWLADCFLQLEINLRDGEWDLKKQHLCFKVVAGKSDERNDLKWHWHEKICGAGGESVRKPNVMRAAHTMTVAQWQGDWMAFRRDGKFDIDKTVENLKAAEMILQKATGETP